jgi:hypothetical protein
MPWHYHNNVQDTFYVLQGRLRLFLRDPKEEIRLEPVRPAPSARAGRTSSRTGATPRRCSWCSRVSASTTTCR